MKSFAVNPPSHEAHDGKSYYEKQYFVLLWCKQSLFPCQFGQIKNVSGKRWWILSGFRLWQEQSIHKHSCLRLTKWSAAHYFCFIFVNSDALFTELHSKPAKQTELLLSTSAQSCCILLCLLGNCAPTLTQRKLGPDIPICVGATLLCTCKRTKNLFIPYFWVCAQLSILLYLLDAIEVTMLLLLQVGGLVLPKLRFSCDMLCRDRVLFQKILGTDLSTLHTNVKLSISSEIRSTDYFVNYTIDFSAFQAMKPGENNKKPNILSAYFLPPCPCNTAHLIYVLSPLSRLEGYSVSLMWEMFHSFVHPFPWLLNFFCFSYILWEVKYQNCTLYSRANCTVRMLVEGHTDVICSFYFCKIFSHPQHLTRSVWSKAVYCHPLAISRMVLCTILFASPDKLPLK